MSVTIKNAVGTAEKDCSSCGTWLKHWEKLTGTTASVCGVMNCNRTDLVGAHVRKVGGYDSALYIYPLCAGCNQSTEELNVWEKYQFVSANPCRW